MQTYMKVSGLEDSTWAPNVSSSVNPVPATGYTAVDEIDGLRLYEIGPAYAGVLFSTVILLPPLVGKGTATLSLEVKTDDAGALRSQAQEFDIMLAGPQGEVYNGSEQNNNAEGGHWQINNSLYKWVDEGFNPGVLPADTFVPISFTMAFDTTAQTSAITANLVGTKTFTPTPLVIPAQQLAWGKNRAVIQMQLDENATPGGYSEKVRNITFEVTFG